MLSQNSTAHRPSFSRMWSLSRDVELARIADDLERQHDQRRLLRFAEIDLGQPAQLGAEIDSRHRLATPAAERRDRHRLDIGDESIARAVNGFDDGLCPAIVADELSRRLDAGIQCAVGHIAPFPYRLVELVTRDDLVAALDQIDEQLEDLGLGCYALTVTPQLEA